MAFDKTYDEIFADVLEGFQNEISGADVSQGSLLYLIGAVFAAGLFGNYENQGFVSRQFFPGLMTDDNILRYGSLVGLVRDDGETVADYRIRVLDHIRQRPAGGTKKDYQRTALTVDGVKIAKSLGPEDGQGPGKVLIVLLSDPTTGVTDQTEVNKLHDADGGFVIGMVGATVTNTDDSTTATITAFVDSGELTLDADIFVSGENYSIDSVIPSTVLVDAVQAVIDIFAPVTAENIVQGATVKSTENVTMNVTGDDVAIPAIVTDITAYIENLNIGETLYISQLEAIAINNGAVSVSVTAPAADVTPASSEVVLLGTVSVS